MKRSRLMLSMLALAAATISCSKDEVLSNGNPTPEPKGEAYVSLTISSPTSALRADGDKLDGTAAENAVTEVALLTFDSKYNFLGTYTAGDLDLTGTKPVYSCAVAADATRFFVIVNYKASSKIEAAMLKMNGTGTSANALYEALDFTTAEVNAMATNGKFVMVNEGTFVSSEDVPLVSLSDGAKLSNDEAVPTLVKINVDRIVSRFGYTVKSGIAGPHVGDFVRIDGVKLNATNKQALIYSEILTTSLTNGADYRRDPNMRLDAATAGTALNWLLNTQDEDKFYPSTEQEYVLENTCDAVRHDYNNLTQAVVKATYTPSGLGLADGESWFSVEIAGKGDIEMSFATLVEYYKGTLDVAKYGAVDATIQANLNEQLNHILSFSKNPTLAAGGLSWDSPEVTLAALDDIKYGGYRAATAPHYYIKYYQNSINYYDIFIQHDEAQDPFHLGRWGMVRNNAYTMNINSIKAPGLPYIPSPFDDDIIDPANPDPDDPEPADKAEAFIDAEITVNPWTIWSQETDLQ